MSKQYELATIKDIFDKVPLHRIEDCMKELTVLVMQCKSVEGSLHGFAYMVTGDANNAQFTFPPSVTWVDDDRENVSIELSVNGVDVGRMDVSVTS